jgi:uncharacterized protein YdeI (YjbR/CyaY-like superfamily)
MIISFKDKTEFKKWLKKSHDEIDGIWLRLFKKGSMEKSITYQEALEEALCYGWIDGQRKSHDEVSWIQRFTPRRAKSIWSKRNTLIVQKLIDEGRMKTPGLKVVEAAKADGRWDAAYASPKEMVLPLEYLKRIQAHKKAYAFYQTLNKSQLYSIALKIHTAKKEETRQRRLDLIIEMLKIGKIFA